MKDFLPANTQQSADKGFLKPKAQPRQSVVSAQVGEFQVVNSILNTPITLKVGKVLAISKDLTDQLTEMIKRKNTWLLLSASLVIHDEFYVENNDQPSC